MFELQNLVSITMQKTSSYFTINLISKNLKKYIFQIPLNVMPYFTYWSSYSTKQHFLQRFIMKNRLFSTPILVSMYIKYTGCAKKKKDILNIHIKSEGVHIFSQKFD